MLKSRLANARAKLKGLREALAGTRAEAQTATIYLSLTTEKIEPGAVGGGPLDNIKDVLAWEAIGLLYFVVVAGPFILVGFPSGSRCGSGAGRSTRACSSRTEPVTVCYLESVGEPASASATPDLVTVCY